jgi:hypothetical protein
VDDAPADALAARSLDREATFRLLDRALLRRLMTLDEQVG